MSTTINNKHYNYNVNHWSYHFIRGFNWQQ